jgi:hypothetical protein
MFERMPDIAGAFDGADDMVIVEVLNGKELRADMEQRGLAECFDMAARQLRQGPVIYFWNEGVGYRRARKDRHAA